MEKFERVYDADELWDEIDRELTRTAPLGPFHAWATDVTARVVGARWLADVEAAGLRRGDGDLEMWIADDPAWGGDRPRQVRVRGPVHA